MPDSEYGSCESLPDSITPKLSTSSNATIKNFPVENGDGQKLKNSAAPTINGAPNTGGTKITGTARITRVNAKYAFIQSQRYGSIFVLPHTISHLFPNQNRFVDLTQFLRVDEIVHFVATEQTNGVNNCRWIAQKLSMPYIQANTGAAMPYGHLPNHETPTANLRTHSDDLIENVRGVVLTVHEKYAFLMTGLYGRVYLPLSACFAGVTDENGAHLGRSEFQKLTDSFLPDDLVIFDACKQPEKNGCKFTVTKVKQIISETENRHAFLADSSMESNSVDTRYSAFDDQDLALATAFIRARKSSEAGSSVSAVESTIQQASIPLRTGEISKLSPQFGFIKCYSLGSVYFTLSNYDGVVQTQSTSATNTPDFNGGGDTIANDQEIDTNENGAATISSLLNVLTLGDRVRFIASSQPMKNGCYWRACRVQKLPPGHFGTDEDFNDLASYLRLNDVNEIDSTNNSSNASESPANSISKSAASSPSRIVVVMEIATQTDVHLWNAFLAAQTPPPSVVKSDGQIVERRSIQTQTIPPPETMLLNALRRNADFKRSLAERFPDLIRYVDKNA